MTFIRLHLCTSFCPHCPPWLLSTALFMVSFVLRSWFIWDTMGKGQGEWHVIFTFGKVPGICEGEDPEENKLGVKRDHRAGAWETPKRSNWQVSVCWRSLHREALPPPRVERLLSEQSRHMSFPRACLLGREGLAHLLPQEAGCVRGTASPRCGPSDGSAHTRGWVSAVGADTGLTASWQPGAGIREYGVSSLSDALNMRCLGGQPGGRVRERVDFLSLKMRGKTGLAIWKSDVLKCLENRAW